MHFVPLHRFWSSISQVPAPHPSSGRCLAAPTALPLSAVQGATEHPAIHTKGLQACPVYVPSVLHSLQPPAGACQSRHPLVLCYLPSRCQRPPSWNNPQIPIWGESAAHQHGSVRPTKRHSLAAQRPPGHTYPVWPGISLSGFHIWAAGTCLSSTQILCTSSLMGCPNHSSLWFPSDRWIHGRSGNLGPNTVFVCPGCCT